MKRVSSLIIVILMLFSGQDAAGERNRYYVASRSLQRVYEHFMGVSLKDAIDSLRAEKYRSEMAYDTDDVIVRFNGGGADDRLYIRRKNTLEILVQNSVVLGGMSLGFEFTCNSGTFSWVADHGMITPANCPVQNALMIYPQAFGGLWTWVPMANGRGYPDSILVGGYAIPPAFPNLPAHSTPTLLYSMQIEISDLATPMTDGFCIDNIYYRPPSGTWTFTDGAGHGYPPNFMGVGNISVTNPNAPPVCFELSEPLCESYGKSSEPGIVHFRDGQIFGPEPEIDFDNVAGLYVNREHIRMINIEIIFEGNEADLQAIGAIISEDKIGKWISVHIPLSDLPRVCQVPGAMWIQLPPEIFEGLDHSTADINCSYVAVQTDLKASGDSVVLGIYDSGLDWLHQDFIDSGGGSRIICYWDQSDDTSAAPPSGYNYGSEYDNADINGFIAASRAGLDYSGHGTHVAGIVLGKRDY